MNESEIVASLDKIYKIGIVHARYSSLLVHHAWTLHAFCQSHHLINGNLLLISPEIVILGQEQHTMTLFSFTHWHTWAIPESLISLCLFIIIMSARTQWSTKLVLVLCQSLDDHGSDGFIHAKVRSRSLGVLFREFAHDFQRF